MANPLSVLFDTSDFPARWHCGNWSSWLGWTHIGADLAIFGAYAAIPIAIAHFVRRRSDVHFTGLYWLFGAFIFSCGFGHLLEATIFWSPQYRLAGIVKVCTATASWATVIVLVRVLPEALTLPGASRLNTDLLREIEIRRQAEAEVLRLNEDLRARVEELRVLFDVVPAAIGIALDPECRTIRTNRAFSAMLRLPAEANASLSAPSEVPLHFRVWADGRPLAPAELPLQRAARDGLPVVGFEEEIRFDDGRRLTVVADAVPLFARDGQVRGAVAVFVDHSELRAAEDRRLNVERRLQETQKLESLGLLAGGIAHDFNNLLTGVLGNASLLRVAIQSRTSGGECLDQIEESTARAAELCRQLLAFAGKGRFVIEKLDLSRVVGDTTSLLQSSIGKQTVLKYELASDLPAVEADATQLRQVIMNLVINASEALEGAPGTITIATGAIELGPSWLETTVVSLPADVRHCVYLEVRDTGCGMTPDVIARMFDPFFTTKFTGRGLGLAAVLGIVRSHRGALKVYSEPGRGTVFKVLLPTVEGAPRLVEAPEARVAWRGAGTVLVVDDDETIRSTSARILRSVGFDVLVASGGRQGIVQFTEHLDEIVLVLLDLTMPEMDGERTFHALRAIRPATRVLLMSGFNEQDAVQRFIGKGLAGFVQKPFGIRELREAVRKQLGES